MNRYYVLNVVRKRHHSQIECSSISEAYHYYLHHYSTIGDWLYYLKTAHKFLHKVTDEKCMIAIFNNVFTDSFVVSYKDTR